MMPYPLEVIGKNFVYYPVDVIELRKLSLCQVPCKLKLSLVEFHSSGDDVLPRRRERSVFGHTQVVGSKKDGFHPIAIEKLQRSAVDLILRRC